MRKPHPWLLLFSDLRFQSTCRCFKSRLALLASLMADLYLYYKYGNIVDIFILDDIYF